MQLLELVNQIAETENMGQVCSDAKVEMNFSQFSRNKMRISWDAMREGEVVRQYAEFQFTGICLNIGQVD